MNSEDERSSRVIGKDEIISTLSSLEHALKLYFENADYHSDVRTMSSKARDLREEWESWMTILQRRYPKELYKPFWQVKAI